MGLISFRLISKKVKKIFVKSTNRVYVCTMTFRYTSKQWLDRVEFAGVIANGRVFRGRTGRWVTFLTLGTNYGEYIDVVVQKPMSYRDGDVVAGAGRVRHQNNSDYIEASTVDSYTFAEWR